MPKEARRTARAIAAELSSSSTPMNNRPGSCKRPEILRNDPHKLIEGALIAGFADARAGLLTF